VAIVRLTFCNFWAALPKSDTISQRKALAPRVKEFSNPLK